MNWVFPGRFAYVNDLERRKQITNTQLRLFESLHSLKSVWLSG